MMAIETIRRLFSRLWRRFGEEDRGPEIHRLSRDRYSYREKELCATVQIEILVGEFDRVLYSKIISARGSAEHSISESHRARIVAELVRYLEAKGHSVKIE